MKSRILHGQTWHCRYLPRKHEFRYPMIWLDIDIDELPQLNRTVRLFGHNRRAVFSIRDSDYAGSANKPIRQKVLNILNAHGVVQPIAQISLITLPRAFGYAFNPVSFFRCYGSDGQLLAMVAAVRNTFGESHDYVLVPRVPERESDTASRFDAPKAFYVSPFLKVSGDYEIILKEDDKSVSILINLRQDDQLVFAADLSGHGTPMGSHSLVNASIKLPWIVSSVMLRITWQALKLYFRKHIPVVARPARHATAVRSKFWHRLRERAVSIASARSSIQSSTPTGIKISEGHSS